MVAHVHRFDRCCISVNALRERKSDFTVNDWILDSGAFTEISTFGRYRTSVSAYASQVNRWSVCGNLLAAVSQDWMCEPFIVKKTGKSVAEHQRLTIDRYDDLYPRCPSIHIMPVLQGYSPTEYVQHLKDYGVRLGHGAWVGVGSICKRNATAREIRIVLEAIKERRPDLRLHGFGIKSLSLRNHRIRSLLHSADSMAWSFAARMNGGGQNDWRNAQKFSEQIEGLRDEPLPLFDAT